MLCQMYRDEGTVFRVPVSIWAQLMLMFIGPRQQRLSYPEGIWASVTLHQVTKLCLFVPVGLHTALFNFPFLYSCLCLQAWTVCLFVHIYSIYAAWICAFMYMCLSGDVTVCSLIFKEVTAWISQTGKCLDTSLTHLLCLTSLYWQMRSHTKYAPYDALMTGWVFYSSRQFLTMLEG